MARKTAGAVTIRDVAEKAGVSIKTVSNVLNGYPYIRPATKEKVDQTIAELGYHINVSARNLSRGRTGFIGLVVPTVRVQYFAELADAVMREASRRGLSVLVDQTDEDRNHELRVLDGSFRSKVDGVIFSPLALSQNDVDLFDVDFPLVILGERVFNAPVDHVTMKNVDGAAAAADYVLDRGAENVVVLGYKADPLPSSGTLRLQGVNQALHRRGLQLDPRSLIDVPDYYHSTGAATLKKILDSGIPVDAVIGFSDTIALGALPILAERGLRVPEDVQVIGFDNIDETEFSIPTLTTVDAGRSAIARQAVSLLAERIDLQLNQTPAEQRPDPRLVLVDFFIVPRSSTKN